MEVGVLFVAYTEPFELVKPGEGPHDHPTDLAQPGSVGDAASGNHRLDAALPQRAAVLVEVVAPIREQPSGSAARSPSQAPDRRHRVQEREELGDVVPVPARERHGKRDSAAVYDQMVLRAGTSTVDRRRTDMIPPFARPDVRAVNGAVVQVE
ncbi:hypothetical protein Kpho01_15260 [Kitasatospora phosalacinea]|uniref:Uncharacterized protein n=1 Tax=Kitasatospora phosalacinea TaxID=2065 RepID=A0A9W6PEC4_9ACTN|nr:hypothetical protein Kpho01_15260 [Kitasatospora phosalacinea]